MGGYGGAYTSDPRNLHDGFKMFMGLLTQVNKPWTDEDDNLETYTRYNLFRQMVRVFIEGAVGDAWKIEGTGASNNFDIAGGDNTPEGALYYYLKGLGLPRFSTVGFDNAGADASETVIHSISTGLSDTTLTDSSANFIVNELVGRKLRPNITSVTEYTITANAATTITCSGGGLAASAAIGDNYLVELSTPSGSDRLDHVWLNAYLDEVDAVEDTSLVRTVEATPIETRRALRLVATIHVREGNATAMTDYVDTDGNQHHVKKIAQIQRYNGNAVIAAVDVTDARALTFSYSELFAIITNAAAFVGALSDFSDSPDYPSNNYVIDGTSLETAIGALDTALQTLAIYSDVHGETLRYHLVPHKFVYYNLPANQTDIEMSYEGPLKQCCVPYAFAIVAAVIQCQAPRTVGSITSKPTVNGTVVVDTSLNLTIDGTDPAKKGADVLTSINDLEGDKFDNVGVKISSSADWVPKDVVTVVLYVFHRDV